MSEGNPKNYIKSDRLIIASAIIAVVGINVWFIKFYGVIPF